MKMKILALFCILTLLLTFTACKPPVSVDSIGSTTETNTTTVTTEPTKTTVTVTEPINTTSATTEPSDTATEPEVPDGLEEMAEDPWYPFIYNGRHPYPFKQPELDLSKFTLGYLYTHNKETDEIYLISDTETDQMDTTRKYVYYRSGDNFKIIRSDYTGETQTVIYASENEITWFDYSAGKLLIVEDKKKIILIDLATGASEEIMEQYCINTAYYHPDASSFTSEDKGRTIQWYGYAEETDELSCYICYIDKNEMYIPTWH